MPIKLLFYFLISTSGIFAQINTIKFEHFAANEGLSHSRVNCIQQDQLGFIWFGTIKGLNQFDGIRFNSYFHNPSDSNSLSSSHITAIFEDSKGNLWIGTSEGLNLFDRQQNNFQRFVHQKQEENSLPHNYIHDILEDSKGQLWIATRGGLTKYDFENHQFESYRHKDYQNNGMVSNNIRCIYEDRNKVLWLGYFGLDGLQKFDPIQKTFTNVLFDKEEVSQIDESMPPLNVTIWDIFEDSKGNFWLGTDEYGLVLLDRNTNTYHIYRDGDERKKGINTETVWSIEEDNMGNLLLATEGGGLNVLNLATFNAKNPQFVHYQVEPLNPYSVNDNFLLSIYKDKDGLIWIGSKDSGINKIDKGIQKFTHYQSNQIAGNNLTNKDVWSILQDHIGNIWIGTADGLNRMDSERANIEYFYNIPSDSSTIAGNHIYSIYQDKELDIWMGTDGGLTKLPFEHILDPQFIQYRHIPIDKASISNNTVNCFLEDEKGNFWIGTKNGLNLMDRKENTFKSFFNPKSEDHNNIQCLLLDKEDQIWMGTVKGLVHFIPSSKKFTIYAQQEGKANNLSNNNIHCLHKDRNHNVWIGTDEGLNRMYKQDGQIHFESYNIRLAIADNTIYAIQEDRQGNLWLSTNTGLTKFNIKNKAIKNFTNKDGLQDGQFNSNASFKNGQKELFFGGSDGLNSFIPNNLPLNERKPDVCLTSFEINYKPVPIRPEGQLQKHISIAEEVTLFPGDNRSFSFEFIALNYTQSEKNAYAYKLENYDKTWQYPPKNQNIAFYTNIDPGNYIFKVKAANNDGVWNEEGTSIKVNIQPTLVQTWYFKVGLFLALLGLGYLIYLNRIRSLHQRSVTLEKMVKERTEQIEKQNHQLEQTIKTLKETRDQLVVSEKMASLGQLTAGIAHEINNPINFISSNVQALKMDFQDMQSVLQKVKALEHSKEPLKLTHELSELGKELDYNLLEEEISELLAGIERGTERTVNIVSSLRTFSRNSTDTFLKADINAGIDSTLTILNSQLNRHVKIEKNYGNIPLVECQISRLNQVFLNIINNAIQAIQTKAANTETVGLISIRTQKVKNKVLITIKDNGNGMDKDTQKRIFEPFFTTKDVGDGTGLGLSISYGIIEQHKGKIEVISALGEGTAFLIHLPISR